MQQLFTRHAKALTRSDNVFIGNSTTGNCFYLIAASKAVRDYGCQTICQVGRNGWQLLDSVEPTIGVLADFTAHTK